MNLGILFLNISILEIFFNVFPKRFELPELFLCFFWNLLTFAFFWAQFWTLRFVCDFVILDLFVACFLIFLTFTIFHKQLLGIFEPQGFFSACFLKFPNFHDFCTDCFELLDFVCFFPGISYNQISQNFPTFNLAVLNLQDFSRYFSWWFRLSLYFFLENFRLPHF